MLKLTTDKQTLTQVQSTILWKILIESHYSVPMWQEPLKMELHNGNYTLYSPNTPCGGPLISFIMGVLDGWLILLFHHHKISSPVIKDIISVLMIIIR